MPKLSKIKLTKPKQDEMCPAGYHVVHGHQRICHSGTRTWVDTHKRRNRGSIPQILLFEKIHYLYWKSNKKYKRIGAIDGFSENAEIDSVIQFWLSYWTDQGLKFPADLDPLWIKTIIAIESSFDPQAKTKIKGSSATGLMQITDQTRGILSGQPRKGYRELTSSYLELSKSDIQDPIVAIAAGMRWLAYKSSTIPKPAQKTLHNTIKNYHSWNDQGEAYAKSVEELYQKSKKNR